MAALALLALTSTACGSSSHRANAAAPRAAPPPSSSSTATTLAPSTTAASTTLPATSASTTTVPVTTTTPTTRPTTTAPAPTTAAAPPSALSAVPPHTVTEIGDSVSLDAAPYLTPAGVVVNAAVSRQFATGIGIVQSLGAAHELPSTLIFALGTNGTVEASEVDQLVAAAVGVHHIVLVTVQVPRTWEASDNAVIEASPGRYPGLITVADWYALSTGHPSWFAADGFHLNPSGAMAFAGLLLAAAGVSP
jgi:lysophospholipase L1-like esterase